MASCTPKSLSSASSVDNGSLGGSASQKAVRLCRVPLWSLYADRLVVQPARLNGSLFRSNRDRKIAASMGSLKQYRTYAAHSSSTYMSNLPAYDSRKFKISLSSVSCRRGSTTWYGHSASSFCSQALRLSGSMVNLFTV